MKFIVSIFFVFTICHTALAQSSKLSIEGTIRESETVAVEFATVALYTLPDSTLVKGVVADEDGHYYIGDVKQGDYYLVVTNFGFKKTFSSKISVTKEAHEAHMDVTMEMDVQESQTVVVEASRPLVKQEAGITTVNVENSALNSGLSLAEAMKRVPGVTVDKDGQVKLKGKDGVMVMLDGKPLYMDAAQVGALLKSIPADQVKEIEVLTSPSAKYDAAGNAGIINIKLKKGAYEGLNGTATTSAGHGVYPKASAGVNLSYKKKRLSLSGGYQYNYRKSMQEFYINRKYPDYGDSSYYSKSRYALPEQTHNAMLNGSYEVGKRGTFLFDGNLMSETYKSVGESGSYLYAPDAAVSSYFITKDNSKGNNFNLNSSVGYKHKFDTTGTELSISTEYKTLRRQSHQQFTTSYFDGEGNSTGSPFDYVSEIPTKLYQWSIKADFEKQLPGKIKMATGIKYNTVQTDANVQNTLTPSNNFVYAESIPAAYVLLQRKFSKWELSGGMRLEDTRGKGVQKSIDSTFRRRYTNLFPSATVSYHHSDKTTYSLLYSKRIERPSYSELNPFVYYNDPYNIYAGNPYLLPQYTHHTEFTVSNWNGIVLSTLNYSYTTQPQSQVWILDNSNLTTTYTTRNLVRQENLGIAFSVNAQPTRWWTMSNYLYLYNNRLTGNVGYGQNSYSRNAWMFNATHTFRLPSKLIAELSGMYESPNYFGTMLYREVWQISAGVQKKVWKEKLTAKISVTDIFWKHVYRGEGTFGNTKVNDGFKWDNRVVMVTLSYRFGHKIGAGDSEDKQGEAGGGGARKR